MPPSVSIVMSTGNRPRNLRNALASWSRIDYPDFDFTLVINGTESDEVKSIAEEYREPLHMQVRRWETQTNINVTYNEYGRSARGEYVIFAMADDIVVHRDVVQRMMAVGEGCRVVLAPYMFDDFQTDAIRPAEWTDDPIIGQPWPVVPDTLLSHVMGNWKKDWDWFGWFVTLHKGHLWIDQNLHLREKVLDRRAVTCKDTWCIHQAHPGENMSAWTAPGFVYRTEREARLLDDAERDKA